MAGTMIRWLARTPSAAPEIELNGTRLPIIIRHHPTAKRMTLRLGADGGEVRVTMPRWGHAAHGVAFAHEHASWLADELARRPALQPPGHGSLIAYRGQKLRINWQADAPRRPHLRADMLHIGGPADGLQPRLTRWLKTQALSLLQDDLQHYCSKAEQAAPALRLSNARRRWGSCSATGTIRINWRLVQAPDFVRRSVVAHEVAHLLHFDHSPAFHACLHQLYEDDLTAANQWLKQYGPQLYTSFG